MNDLRLGRPVGSVERLTMTASTDSGVWEYTFDPVGALDPIFRFYNTQTGAHFYTTQDDERNAVDQLPQFADEGVACNVYPTTSQH